MMRQDARERAIYFGTVATVYAILLAVSISWPYFWDNILQVGGEGTWIYNHGLGTLITRDAAGEAGTGYHVPGVAYVTALAWTVFGRSLWVSHVLTFIWAAGLAWAVWRLCERLMPAGWRAAVGLAVMVEPAVLTLMATVSPDFWMLSAFALALAALAEGKYWRAGLWLLALGLCNMRGVMAAVCLGLAVCFCLILRKELSWRRVVALALPSVVVIGAYYVIYLAEYGWFMNGSNFSEHYEMPSSGAFIARHIAALGLRMLEQGRVAVWALALCVACVGAWRARAMGLFKEYGVWAVALVFVVLQCGLYLLFCFISQMPFGGRYFSMLHLALTLCVLAVVTTVASRRTSIICLAVVFAAEVSGHAWEAFYPDRMSKPWDTTLAHAPFYGLRQEVEADIDQMGIARTDISSGFTVGGSGKIAYLDDDNPGFTGGDDAPYYLLSNICNEEDDILDHIDAHGEPIRTWRRGAVYFTLYKMNP